MRKFIVAALVAGAVSTGYSWEFPRNPDRFPSAGLSYDRQVTSGLVDSHLETINGQSVYVDTFAGAGSTNLDLDLRFPVNDHLTLGGQGGKVWQQDGGAGLTGYHVKLSARVYFNP